jgi:hypothetical protein
VQIAQALHDLAELVGRELRHLEHVDLQAA